MEELTGEAVYLQSGQIMFQKKKKEHMKKTNSTPIRILSK